VSGYAVALIVFVLIIGGILALVVRADLREKRARPTDDAVAPAGPRYRQYLARFRSRARFVLTLEVEGADQDGEVVSASSDPTVWLLVSAGVTNASNADAGQTTMRVLVPREYEARWTGAYSTVEPEPATELLQVGEREVPANCLTKVEQVGPRDNPVVTVILPVSVPAAGDGPVRIPIRFRAFSNDLGVGEDPVIDRVFSVRRA
jgi:hypothetical protein